MPAFLNRLLKAPMRAALQLPAVRKRVAFEIGQSHYEDLEIAVPLGYGLTCPVGFPAAWWSFKEIFLDREYEAAFLNREPPRRWLDIGCFAGYFSLYIAWLRACRGLNGQVSALLIDGDPRVKPQVERLIDLNSLTGSLAFVHGAIAETPGQTRFSQRESLNSSLAGEGEGDACLVLGLSALDILNKLPPPYDLIKIDIEGAEHRFLSSYQPVVAATTRLLMEWHSWSSGGGLAELESVLAASGLRLEEEISPARPVEHLGIAGSCGVRLYCRDGQTGQALP